MAKIVTESIDFSAIPISERPPVGSTIIGIDTADGRLKRMDSSGNVTDIEQPPVVIPTPYTHFQAIASTIWTVNHMRNKKPGVTVQDTGGTDWDGKVHYVSLNQLTIEFSVAITGYAYID